MRNGLALLSASLLAVSGLVAAAEGCSSFSEDEPSPANEAGPETSIGAEASLDAASDADARTRSLKGVYLVGFGDALDGGAEGGTAFATDVVGTPSGGAVVAGSYTGKVDLGGGASLPATVAGSTDAFLLELGGQGQRLSSLAFGGAGGGAAEQYGSGLAIVDTSRFLGIIYAGTVQLSAVTNLSSQGPYNSVIGRFSDATYKGHQEIYGTGSLFVRGLAAGALGGGVIAVGDYAGQLNLAGTSANQATDSAVFLARLFPIAGEQPKVKLVGGGAGSSSVAFGLATNEKSHTVIAGRFIGSVGLGDAGIVSGTETDAFIARFDATLEPIWVRKIGGVGLQEGRAVAAIPGTDDFIVAGQFTSSIQLPGAPDVLSKGNSDVFVVRMNAAGAIVWSKTFGGPGEDAVVSVKVDTQGNLFIAGYYNGAVLDLGGGPLANADKAGKGSRDAYVGWFDAASGAHVYSARFGDGASDAVTSMSLDGNGDVVIAGGFGGVLDVGTGPITARGNTDIFVAKLKPQSD